MWRSLLRWNLRSCGPSHGRKFASSMSSSTVDNEEVRKFEEMASQWWSPDGPASALHSMNQLRVPLIRDGMIQTSPASANASLSPHPLAGLSILDAGCGGGILSERLARLGANVTGIDPVPANIRAAQEHAKLDPDLNEKLQYESTTVEDLLASRPDLRFDAIVASEVVEHVASPQLFISTCSALLRHEGSLFITTINRTTRSWLGAIIAAEYILRLLPVGTHDWQKFITPEELEEMLLVSGFKVRLCHGMAFIPGISKWMWIPDQAINYAVHAVKTKSST